jgi:hypothetical protein
MIRNARPDAQRAGGVISVWCGGGGRAPGWAGWRVLAFGNGAGAPAGNHPLRMMTAITWMNFSHQFPAVNGCQIGVGVSSEAVFVQVSDATWALVSDFLISRRSWAKMSCWLGIAGRLRHSYLWPT